MLHRVAVDFSVCVPCRGSEDLSDVDTVMDCAHAAYYLTWPGGALDIVEKSFDRAFRPTPYKAHIQAQKA